MTVFAHTISASVLSLMIAGVHPFEANYLLASLIVPASLDIDHLILLITRRKDFKKEGVIGNLHKARSFMHEMLGVLIMAIVAGIIMIFDRKMSTVIFFSYLIHVIEDIIMGISIPFNPVSFRECFLFKFSFKQKVFVDFCVIIISILLWVNYLKG